LTTDSLGVGGRAFERGAVDGAMRKNGEATLLHTQTDLQATHDDRSRQVPFHSVEAAARRVEVWREKVKERLLGSHGPEVLWVIALQVAQNCQLVARLHIVG
jgi:hypothetical protein